LGALGTLDDTTSGIETSLEIFLLPLPELTMASTSMDVDSVLQAAAGNEL
jgi:hypothetical protein